MLHFQINFKSGKPVYLQLVDQVKTAVASGAMKSGEALPSIRPLAEELRVNRNTVAKAYTELENQGVIETLAGKGCFRACRQLAVAQGSAKDAAGAGPGRGGRSRRITCRSAARTS